MLVGPTQLDRAGRAQQRRCDPRSELNIQKQLVIVKCRVRRLTGVVNARHRVFPVCNVLDDGATLEMPDGAKVEFDKKGWRQ